MATASASSTTTFESTKNRQELMKILLPYGLAILAQLPMLSLYFKMLWERPHYQFFPFAIIATIVLAVIRWPYNTEQPFHRSLTSDLLLVLGLGSAIMGMLFVEPWFAAFSVMMIVASLLTRTTEEGTQQSLWTCALPLFVCLMLPFNYDAVVITRLQAYSAQFTSQLLDVIGLGHHMNGTVIKVPSGKQYGVEEACSGVVSFFTLIAVTTAFIVWARRIATPQPFISGLLIVAGLLIFIIESASVGAGYYSLVGIGLILAGLLGFRSSVLLMSAVFWALFMNTVRIFTIPVAEIRMGIDLSHGFAHDILGYIVLIAGVMLILSTDQFLTFLFGSVEAVSEEASFLQKTITNFWNKALAGNQATEETSSRRRRRSRKPITPFGRALIWTVAGIMVCCGLYQLWDVKQSFANDEYTVRFWDADVTVDFQKDDVPELIGNDWKQVDYVNQERSRGSDLGRRSDVWQFQSPRCSAVASLDQPFPGWHELTTCYTSLGWKMVNRVRHTPEVAEGEEPWQYIEASFVKETGEKGYLLFSHFDAFGDPVEAPERWATLNSLLIRAQGRLSNRVRATLFDAQVYQTQVFLSSFNELSDPVKAEVEDRYLEIREVLREGFKAKRAAESIKE